jgi:hypothetical protein
MKATFVLVLCVVLVFVAAAVPQEGTGLNATLDLPQWSSLSGQALEERRACHPACLLLVMWTEHGSIISIPVVQNYYNHYCIQKKPFNISRNKLPVYIIRLNTKTRKKQICKCNWWQLINTILIIFVSHYLRRVGAIACVTQREVNMEAALEPDHPHQTSRKVQVADCIRPRLFRSCTTRPLCIFFHYVAIFLERKD